MSLMQLLAVGKSIIGLSAGRSPYRMREENLLPKFGPAKGAKAKPPAPAEAAPSIPKNVPKAEEPQTSQSATETKGNEMNAVVAGTETESEPGHTRRSAETAHPFGRWTRLNPFHARFSKQSDAAPVQGELLLETVKVMRNDLSDADLEVVSSGQNSPPRAGNAQREPAADSESSGLVLGRMTARLFGAGRT